MVINKIKIPSTNVAIDVNDARIPALTNNAGKVLSVNSGATGMEWKEEEGGEKTELKTNQEFIYRKTNVDWNASAGVLDRIKGKTLVWNQIFAHTYQAPTQDGISCEVNNDGSLRFHGTSTSTDDFVNYYLDMSMVPVIAGHKYAIVGWSDNPKVLFAYTYGALTGTVVYAGGAIVEGSTTGYGYAYIRLDVANGASIDITIYPMMFDLTLMFGPGNEPSTVAEFEALYPGYYPYNAGTLINNDAEAIETVGFNKWDEEWELGRIASDGSPVSSDTEIRSKNFCPIVGGCDVCFRVPVLGSIFYFYDADFNFVDYWGGGTPARVVSIPSNCAYFKISMGGNYGTTYLHDICINLSDPAKNGTYEPYRKSTMQLNLGSFQVRDSQGNVTTITGGLKSAGSVYDEIVGNKYYKRVGEVDLGDLPWTKDIVGTHWRFLSGALEDVQMQPWTVPGNSMCDKYVTIAGSNTVSGNSGIAINDDSKKIIVVDESHSDEPTASNNWISSVILYYELATPEEYDLVEPIVNVYPCDQLGTERAVSPSTISAPMVADIQYGATAGDLASDIIAVDSKVNAKQDTLVSGTNIKTINSQSILGSGNISISVSPDIASQQEIDSLFVEQSSEEYS